MCCGMLCNAQNLLAIFEWGRAHQDWCKRNFGFKQRTPCTSTLHRVIKDLDIQSFETVLLQWFTNHPTAKLIETLQPLAIDGKQVRGSKTAHQTALHLLTAFSSFRGAVEGQVAVGEKTNEITHAPELLQSLDLNNKVVTADALLTQRQICEQIVHRGGDYLMEVKGNQEALNTQIAQAFFGGQ